MYNDQPLPAGSFATSDSGSPAGPANLSVPAASPIAQQAITTPGQQQQQAASGGSSSGSSGSNIAGKVGSTVGMIGGTMIGGPIGGAIGSTLGSLFGGLFAQGGYVQGYAEGGPMTNPGNALDPNMLALGYLTGALHQQQYGGTPDTLNQAAEEIKQLIAQQGDQADTPQFAQGGPTQYQGGGMGMSSPNGPQYGNQMGMAPPQGMEGMPPLGNPPPTPGMPGMQGQPNRGMMQRLPQMAQNRQQMGQIRGNGFARPMPPMQTQQMMAEGGPPMPPPEGGPPGMFMGEGEVDGPGTMSSDSIPAKLSDGEFVMSGPATQFYGVDKLVKMNEAGKQGFMQAMQQVEANQPGGGAPPPPGGGPPMAPPGAPPPGGMPPPAPGPMPGGGGNPMGALAGLMGGKPQMKSGGPAMRPKSSGYMGI